MADELSRAALAGDGGGIDVGAEGSDASPAWMLDPAQVAAAAARRDAASRAPPAAGRPP